MVRPPNNQGELSYDNVGPVKVAETLDTLSAGAEAANSGPAYSAAHAAQKARDEIADIFADGKEKQAPPEERPLTSDEVEKLTRDVTAIGEILEGVRREELGLAA